MIIFLIKSSTSNCRSSDFFLLSTQMFKFRYEQLILLIDSKVRRWMKVFLKSILFYHYIFVMLKKFFKNEIKISLEFFHSHTRKLYIPLRNNVRPHKEVCYASLKLVTIFGEGQLFRPFSCYGLILWDLCIKYSIISENRH